MDLCSKGVSKGIHLTLIFVTSLLSYSSTLASGMKSRASRPHSSTAGAASQPSTAWMTTVPWRSTTRARSREFKYIIFPQNVHAVMLCCGVTGNPHDCASQINEKLMLSNSKLISDSELVSNWCSCSVYHMMATMTVGEEIKYGCIYIKKSCVSLSYGSKL